MALDARVDVRRPSLPALGDLHDVIRDTEPAENELHEERLAPRGPGGAPTRSLQLKSGDG